MLILSINRDYKLFNVPRRNREMVPHGQQFHCTADPYILCLLSLKVFVKTFISHVLVAVYLVVYDGATLAQKLKEPFFTISCRMFSKFQRLPSLFQCTTLLLCLLCLQKELHTVVATNHKVHTHTHLRTAVGHVRRRVQAVVSL